MPKSTKLKICFTWAFLAVSSTLFAQVKIGSNPTVIGTNSNLEVESANGNKTLIQKDNGNMGVGTATPGNKLEIKSDAVNTSGLRFTNLNNTSPAPPSTSALLGVNASGDVVVTDGAAAKQYLSVAVGGGLGVNPNETVTCSNIIAMNPLNPVPYNPATGIATLTVGKTYLINASLHVTQWNGNASTFGWLQYAVVNATNNALLNHSGRAELLSATYLGTAASSGSISMIYKAVAGANLIKLFITDISNAATNGPGQALIRGDLFSGFTVVEL